MLPDRAEHHSNCYLDMVGKVFNIQFVTGNTDMLNIEAMVVAGKRTRTLYLCYISLLSGLIATMIVVPQSALGREISDDHPNLGDDSLELLSNAYIDEEYGISIRYPSDWEKQERDEGSIVVFLSPELSAGEDSSSTLEHLALYVDRGLGRSDLSSYSERLIARYAEELDGFSLVNSESAVLAGAGAQRLIFDFVDSSNVIRVQDIWTVRNNVVYHAVFYADPQDFPQYHAIINAMLESLEIGPALINRPISGGIYDIPSIGLEITLPSGWSGYEVHEEGSIFSFVSDSEFRTTPIERGNDISAVTFVFVDTPDNFELQKRWSAFGCDLPHDAQMVNVAGLKAIEVRVSCSDQQIRELLFYELVSQDTGFYIGYGAPSIESFESNLPAFQESMRSIKLNHPGDPSQVNHFARIKSIDYTVHQITIGGDTYDFGISSSSKVRNVTLEEENNRLVFNLETTTDPVEIFFRPTDFLDGPYVITFDGVVMEEGIFAMRDGSHLYLDIVFDGNPGGTLIITGTSVTPEYHELLLATSASVSAALVASRFRKYCLKC
jgi:hypothetical protein